MAASQFRVDPDATYKDLDAVTIESDLLAATFLPDPGAKLASLVYKPIDKELLVQRSNDRYRHQPFDGTYVEGEVNGFDEMFPTVDRWIYDQYPWDGTVMSDHGEVWSLPWSAAASDPGIHFSTAGVRFPYSLHKTAHFQDESTLRLSYRLVNRSGFDLLCIWAAHIMLALEPGAELILPEEVESIFLTFDFGERFGGFGTRYSYPKDSLLDGKEFDFSKLNPKEAGNCYKYYVEGPLQTGACSVVLPESGIIFRCQFPADTVPYLGILPNEGGWEDLYNIFLEPCTAPYDRPDRARDYGADFILPGNGQVEWTLDLGVDRL